MYNDPIELEGLDPSALRNITDFGVENPPEPMRRVTMFRDPIEGHRHAAGVDWALGLPGRDKDTLCMLDVDSDPPEQVMQISGHWGETFDRVVYGACKIFPSTFLVGEANSIGLGRLQRIYKDFGYKWVYFENRGGERKKLRRRSDNLGAYRSQPARLDPIISAFRRIVIDKGIDLRDEPLIDQMGKLQWTVVSESIEHADATDSDLVMKLSGGGSPDLVMSAALAYWGLLKMDLYKQPSPDVDALEVGSAGDILDHKGVFDDEDDAGPNDLSSRRRRKGR